jgi:hypothetical protein
MEIPEDPVARPDDRPGLPLDEVAECVTVASEDRIDDRTLTALIIRAGVGRSTEDVATP